MIIEIREKRYTLPQDTIITVVSLQENTIRVCFHYHEKYRSGIDIDSAGMGIFEGIGGIIHSLHCVCSDDAEEFDRWYRSMH